MKSKSSSKLKLLQSTKIRKRLRSSLQMLKESLKKRKRKKLLLMKLAGSSEALLNAVPDVVS
jgi:hypothetical protein